jgi:hypothetical protein
MSIDKGNSKKYAATFFTPEIQMNSACYLLGRNVRHTYTTKRPACAAAHSQQ